MSDWAMQQISTKAGFLPHLSLSFNALSIKPLAWLAGAPNYNTPFAEVPGIQSDRVKWFIEAQGRQYDDPVLLYAHGGGYSLGVFPTMAEMLLSIWKKVGNPRLSILWVDYTLVYEGGEFPRQLQEIVAVYNKLQESCSRIILLGDSAGAHLFCTMIRHARVESVDTVEQLQEAEKTIAGIFVSPWVNLSSGSSFGELFEPDPDKREAPGLNPYKDLINWHSILPRDMLVTFGECEGSRSSIEKWIELSKLERSQVYMQKKGGHDSLAVYADLSPVLNVVVQFLQQIAT